MNVSTFTPETYHNGCPTASGEFIMECDDDYIPEIKNEQCDPPSVEQQEHVSWTLFDQIVEQWDEHDEEKDLDEKDEDLDEKDEDLNEKDEDLEEKDEDLDEKDEDRSSGTYVCRAGHEPPEHVGISEDRGFVEQMSLTSDKARLQPRATQQQKSSTSAVPTFSMPDRTRVTGHGDRSPVELVHTRTSSLPRVEKRKRVQTAKYQEYNKYLYESLKPSRLQPECRSSGKSVCRADHEQPEIIVVSGDRRSVKQMSLASDKSRLQPRATQQQKSSTSAVPTFPMPDRTRVTGHGDRSPVEHVHTRTSSLPRMEKRKRVQTAKYQVHTRTSSLPQVEKRKRVQTAKYQEYNKHLYKSLMLSDSQQCGSQDCDDEATTTKSRNDANKLEKHRVLSKSRKQREDEVTCDSFRRSKILKRRALTTSQRVTKIAKKRAKKQSPYAYDISKPDIYTKTVHHHSRIYDCKHACFYCKKLRCNILAHLRDRHEREPEMQDISQLKQRLKDMTEGAAKSELLDLVAQKQNLLRARGDHLHNVEVEQMGKGEIILARRRRERQDQFNLTNYGPCPYCLSWIQIKAYACITRHVSKCPAKNTEQLDTLDHIQTQSAMLSMRVVENNTGQQVTYKYLSACPDLVTIAEGDPLIMTLHSAVLSTCPGGSEDRKYSQNISTKLKRWTRFLQIMRVKLKNPTLALAECLKAELFDEACNAALQLASCDLDNGNDGQKSHPSTALKVGPDLREAVYAKREQYPDTTDECDEFLKLVMTEWRPRMLDMMKDLLEQRRASKTKWLPKLEDLKSVLVYLKEELGNSDLSDPSKQNFNRIVESTACMLFFYNKRKSQELQNMRVQDYINRKRGVCDLDQGLKDELTDLEMRLLGSHDVIELRPQTFVLDTETGQFFTEVRTKLTRPVPLLVPTECQDKLAFLADPENRRRALISEENPFLFTRCSKNNGPNQNALRIYPMLKDVGRKVNVKISRGLSASATKSYISTVIQVLSLDDCEIKSVQSHLTNIEGIHRQFNGTTSEAEANLSLDPDTSREQRPTTGENPETETSKEARSNTGENPETETLKEARSNNGEIPETETSKESRSNTGESPETETSEEARSNTGEVPETETAKEARSNTGESPETETSEKARSNTGEVSETETSKEVTSNTGESPETETLEEPRSNTGEVPETETSKESMSNTGENPETETSKESMSNTWKIPETETSKEPRSNKCSGEVPVSEISKESRTNTGEILQIETSNKTKSNAGELPESETLRKAMLNTEEIPENGNLKESRSHTREMTETSKEPMSNTGEIPETGTSKDPMSNTGEIPETETSKELMSNTGEIPETETSKEPLSNTGEIPETETSKELMSDTGEIPETETVREPRSNTGNIQETESSGSPVSNASKEMSSELVKISDITKLLLIQELDLFGQFVGRQLSEISHEDIIFFKASCLETLEEAGDELGTSNHETRDMRLHNLAVRIRWSRQEEEELAELFAENFRSGSIPNQQDVLAAMAVSKANKGVIHCRENWETIKKKVWNMQQKNNNQHQVITEATTDEISEIEGHLAGIDCEVIASGTSLIQHLDNDENFVGQAEEDDDDIEPVMKKPKKSVRVPWSLREENELVDLFKANFEEMSTPKQDDVQTAQRLSKENNGFIYRRKNWETIKKKVWNMIKKRSLSATAMRSTTVDLGEVGEVNGVPDASGEWNIEIRHSSRNVSKQVPARGEDSDSVEVSDVEDLDYSPSCRSESVKPKNPPRQPWSKAEEAELKELFHSNLQSKSTPKEHEIRRAQANSKRKKGLIYKRENWKTIKKKVWRMLQKS